MKVKAGRFGRGTKVLVGNRRAQAARMVAAGERFWTVFVELVADAKKVDPSRSLAHGLECFLLRKALSVGKSRLLQPITAVPAELAVECASAEIDRSRAARLAPFDYSEIGAATLYGPLVFGDWPDTVGLGRHWPDCCQWHRRQLA
jgi:hypothetical protein